MRYDYCDIKPIDLPCGAVAEFDYESGISYRCTTCFAVVGSIGMPRDCKQLMDDEEEKKQIWKTLNE